MAACAGSSPPPPEWRSITSGSKPSANSWLRTRRRGFTSRARSFAAHSRANLKLRLGKVRGRADERGRGRRQQNRVTGRATRLDRARLIRRARKQGGGLVRSLCQLCGDVSRRAGGRGDRLLLRLPQLLTSLFSPKRHQAAQAQADPDAPRFAQQTANERDRQAV